MEEENFIYKTVMLGDIDDSKNKFHIMNKSRSINNDTDTKFPIEFNDDYLMGTYDWESLEKSIKKHGLLNPLYVKPYQDKYRIRDGNHRMYILKKLFNDDYKVKIKLWKE